MFGVVPGEGQKRRLPLWMLGVGAGVGAADQSAEIANVNNKNDINNPDENQRIASKPYRPKSKKSRKESPTETDSCLPATRQTKGRKRKLTRSLDGNCDSNICENGMAKKKPDGVGRALVKVSVPRKRRKAKSFTVESSEDINIPSPTDDDGELTMEDLMNIAKEYIVTDKDTDQQQLLDRKQEAESQLSAVSFSTDQLEGALNVPQHSTISPTLEETTFIHNSTENSTKEGIISNPRTGDPTQDMLDLLLGPLLRKPLEEEKKIESIMQDLTFSYELKKQNQNDVLGEELIPLTKKKSSLRDKVALFLD